MVEFLLRRDEEGQGLAEYALILALIAIIAIAALLFLGGQISAILSTIGARSRASLFQSLPKGPSRQGRALLHARILESVHARTSAS